jgi:phosphoribosylformylglycinamidine synthase
MDKPRAVILRAAGINCDVETEKALQLAGADAQRIHINSMIGKDNFFDDYQIVVFAGGFSYGDDVSAGKILANQVIHHLREQIQKFIDQGKLVIGICNGFQVLVKAGILPGLPGMEEANDYVTIANNDNGKFEDRWVYLEPDSKRCVFLQNAPRIYLPVAHGEGKVVTKDKDTLDNIIQNGYVALRYVDSQGNRGDFPVNPNGSMDAIAGLTDSTGRVLGLMPHPERHIHRCQHPHWTRLGDDREPDGMVIFNNAVEYVRQNF